MSQAIEQEIRTLRAHFWSARDPEGRAFAPLADAYRRKGDLDEAMALAEDGLARLPEFTPGHLISARIHRARGSLTDARQALDRVLDLDPENVLALLERAELSRDAGDRDGAMADLRTLLAAEPGHLGARAALDRLEAASPPPEADTPTEVPQEEGEPVVAPADEEELDAEEEPEDASIPGEHVAGEPSAGLDVFGFDMEFHEQVDAEADDPDEDLQDVPELPEDELVFDDLMAEDLESLEAEGDSELEGFDLESMEGGIANLNEDLELEREPSELGLDDAAEVQSEGIDPDEPYVDFQRTEPVMEEPSAAEDPADGVPPHLQTRTMAELYLEQGLRDQALVVYESLLERDPDDPTLQARVDQLKGELGQAAPSETETPSGEPVAHEAADPDLEDGPGPDELAEVAPQWTSDAEDELAPATPFAWDSDEGPAETGEGDEPLEFHRPIRSHFDDLLAWVPGAVSVSDLSPDAPVERAPDDSPLARAGAEDAGATASQEGSTEPAGPREGGTGDDDDDLDDFRSWLKSLDS